CLCRNKAETLTPCRFDTFRNGTLFRNRASSIARRSGWEQIEQGLGIFPLVVRRVHVQVHYCVGINRIKMTAQRVPDRCIDLWWEEVHIRVHNGSQTAQFHPNSSTYPEVNWLIPSNRCEAVSNC